MPTQVPPLPIVDTAIAAARLTYSNLAYLACICWAGVLALAAASFLLFYVGLATSGFGALLYVAFHLLVFGMIAVAWHRFILIGETINEAWYFKIDQTALSYAANTIAIVAIVGLPLFAIVYLLAALNGPLAAGAMFAGAFASTWIVARLCLVLPAKALRSRIVTLGSVWQMTQGQDWPLLAGALLSGLAAIPLALAAALVIFLLAATGLDPQGVAVQAVSTASAIATELVYLSFLSLAFRHIYGLEPPPSKD